MPLYTPEQFSKEFESKPKVWGKPEDADGFNFNHSNFKLPLNQLEDVKKMDDKQIATHINPAAGPGFRAIRALKAQQNGQSRRKSRSKKARKSRSKKVRKTRRV